MQAVLKISLFSYQVYPQYHQAQPARCEPLRFLRYACLACWPLLILYCSCRLFVPALGSPSSAPAHFGPTWLSRCAFLAHGPLLTLPPFLLGSPLLSPSMLVIGPLLTRDLGGPAFWAPNDPENVLRHIFHANNTFWRIFSCFFMC
jgi:hypothetical protein